MTELEIRVKRGKKGRTTETFVSLQCIDQIKEALQLQKRKKHDFFLLHFRFVNFYQSSNDYIKCFFNILFVHNTHTIDFKIYNIHNFSLKQSRFFFFFSSLYNRTTLWWTQFAGSPPMTGKREIFFFFYKTNRTKNTHTQKRTRRRPTQRRNSKDLLQRSLMPTLSRQGDVTNKVVLLLFSRELYHHWELLYHCC